MKASETQAWQPVIANERGFCMPWDNCIVSQQKSAAMGKLHGPPCSAKGCHAAHSSGLLRSRKAWQPNMQPMRRRGNFVQGDDRLCLGKGPGIVYLIRRSDGLHKIGHTSNLKKRFALAKYENRDYFLEIVHTVYVDNRIEAEKWWHRRFASKRVRNEWFDLSADDVNLFLAWGQSS